MTAGEVAERLGAKRSGTGWTARCPAHEDGNPSLSISAGTDGRTLLHCHAGCDHAAVLSAAGLGEADLFTESRALPKPERRLVATYAYRDENERHLFDVLRYSPKDFRQRKADGSWSLNGTRRVLYRLPEVLARPEGAPVWIVEGEKDADAIAGLGLAATCNPGGAGKWRAEYGETLRGANVIIVPDHDGPGEKHAAEIAHQLAGVAASVRVLELPGAKDASDWLALGGTMADLDRLAAELLPASVGTGRVTAPASDALEVRRTWGTLAELLQDPSLTAPPEPIAPPLGYIGRLTLLAGREKSGGKSTAAGAAGADASRLGVTVLIFSLDEPTADTVQRMARLGADPVRVIIAWGRPDNLRELVQVLRDLIVQTGARLVIIDSLEKWAEGCVTESGNSFQWGAVLSPLQAVARELLIAVIIIHHANKADGGYRDSTAIGAAVDLIVELREQPDGTRRAKVRGRFAVPDFTVALDAASGRVTFTADGASTTAIPTGTATQETQRAILQLLQNAEPEGFKSNEWKRAATDCKISPATFYRARRALHGSGLASYTSRLYRVTPKGARLLQAGES